MRVVIKFKMTKIRVHIWIAVVAACCSPNELFAADVESGYSIPDQELKAVQVDSSGSESFLAVRGDSRGRIFVGGREALFLYEPDEHGGYQERHELLRFPKDTWIYDIEIRGHDLYVVTINAVYLIPEGAVKTEDLEPQRLIWGMPFGHVHQGMHGLAWGPEGDLYISMGDPLWYYGDFKRPDHWGHWTFFGPDGAKLPYTGMGGVLRCRPDGSNLQVVARGTRNSCGIAFDHNWNLFTNDNDQESMPAEYVPGRLLHVAPHSFLGWPRGWMQSKSPDRFDLLPDMFEGMGRGVPVGQAYYDEALLPEKFRNNLLVARWGNRTVSRYPLRRSGASFKTEEFVVLEGHGEARPVGVCVARGGRIFVTIAYMAQNDTSPIYKSDLVMITRANDAKTHPFDRYDVKSASTLKLADELGDASWQRRYRAHAEWLRRSSKNTATRDQPPVDLSGITADQLNHWLWLIAAGSKSATQLLPYAQHDSAQVRVQAVRAIAEFYSDQPEVAPILREALGDKDPRVQHAALVGLFGQSGGLPQEVLSGPARSNDGYLRQAAATLLAQRATSDMLGEACKSKDFETRLAGVLAVGFRLTVPSATASIAKELPLQSWKRREAYLPTYFREQLDLKKLGRVGTFTFAEHWNAGKHTPEQDALFALLTDRLGDSDSRVQLQAAFFLSLLNDSRSEPMIEKVRGASARNRLAEQPVTTIRRAWIVGPFADGRAGLKRSHPPEQTAIDLSAKYTSADKQVAWVESAEAEVFDFGKTFTTPAKSSFYAYFRLQTPRSQPVMLRTKSDDAVQVWHNGSVVMTNQRIRAKKKKIGTNDSVLLTLEPGSNDLLIRTHNVAGPCQLKLQYQALDDVTFALPENLGISSLAERLKSAGDGPEKVSPEFAQIDWATAAKKGDAQSGRKLFGIDGIGCVKCHAVDARSAVSGAPSLVGTAKRFTVPHLVESVLMPSKQISPIFRGTMILTDAGRVHTGLVVGETAAFVELMLSDAKRIKITKDEIALRKFQDVSPMPAGLVKTPEELRDILSYLLHEE